jgi:hypothetical protein
VLCSLSYRSQLLTCVKQLIISFRVTFLCEIACHPVHSNLPVWSSLSSRSQQITCTKQWFQHCWWSEASPETSRWYACYRSKDSPAISCPGYFEAAATISLTAPVFYADSLRQTQFCLLPLVSQNKVFESNYPEYVCFFIFH